MKKILLFCIVLLLVAAGMLSCSENKAAQSEENYSSTASTADTTLTTSSHTAANLAPPYIMINGTLYWIGSQRYHLPVEEDDIVGYVTSTVPPNKVPTENDQSNTIGVGTPYALYEHEEYGLVYVVQNGYYWNYLTPDN